MVPEPGAHRHRLSPLILLSVTGLVLGAPAVQPPGGAQRPVEVRPMARVVAGAVGIKPLLLAAIGQGHAQGTLGAAVDQGLAEVFRSPAPIEVTVHRLHWLEQTGCARLRVQTTQAAVVNGSASAPASLPGLARLAYRLSYCAHGGFPHAGPQLALSEGPDPVTSASGPPASAPEQGGTK